MAGAGAAPALGGWPGAGAAAPAGLERCISLAGPGPLRSDGDMHDYRYHGNRAYVRDRSKTGWVKLWVSWHDLQRDFQPAGPAQSWRQLNAVRYGPGQPPMLRLLDRQIRAANDDGVRVILTPYQAFPLWASGAVAGERDASGRKQDIARLPTDLSPSGPWAWFIAHLLARYRRGAAPNPGGPQALGPPGFPGLDLGAATGNPSGAYVDALEVVNEPNLSFWPLADALPATAAMLRTAEELAASWWTGTDQFLLAGSLSDGDPRPGVATAFGEFTASLLGLLAGWQPRLYVGWAHHNYRDVEDPRRTSRVAELRRRLVKGGWNGGGPLRIYLTEGGHRVPGGSHNRPAALREQAAAITANAARMRAEPDVVLWTQHTIHDRDRPPGEMVEPFHSGLRDAPVITPDGLRLGRPRAAWSAWSGLPPS